MRNRIRVEFHTSTGPAQYGAGVWLYLPARMLRVWASLDKAYGSHWGFWRTDYTELQGVNWRGGWRRMPVTLLAHTRKMVA
jgi:hypothetical protein